MVEYAIAGMDNKLFVSTYMLQLPDKTTLEKFLLDEMKNKIYHFLSTLTLHLRQLKSIKHRSI